MKSYAELKQRQRAERDRHGENLGVRVHRALSWLERAEKCDDDDGRMIFLWVAFNAAYANELGSDHRVCEARLVYNFIKLLCSLDEQNRLEKLTWDEFPRSIRLLLNNKFIFQPYWNFLNREISAEEWRRRFANAKARANQALGRRDTARVLDLVLSRIYTLRNQLIHGGATWNSRVNRRQVNDATRFMADFVPIVTEIMLDHPDRLWGDPCYPVIK